MISSNTDPKIILFDIYNENVFMIVLESPNEFYC